MQELFFELIQVAIGTTGCLSHTPSADEWGKLYDMAKKQSLVGLCFAGVQKLVGRQQEPPEMLYLTWMGMAAKIQQRNEVMNRQCVDLQKRLSDDGFRSYIMKGQAVASLYRVSEGFSFDSAQEPKFQEVSEGSMSDNLSNHSNSSNLSQLRQSGDIDIYLEGGYEKVNEYVQRVCPTKDMNELEMHCAFFPDTEVEVHFKPFVMEGPKDRILQRFFKDSEEENFSNTLNLSNQLNPSEPLAICAPTLKFNLVHQLVHIHHHLFYEGVGMRQVMDYHFVVKHEMEVENGSSVQEVKKVISDLGLERFASALMWVIGYVFDHGMLETWLLKPETALWKPNEKDGRFLLDEIMQSGNFGKQDERQRGLYDSKWNSFWMVHFKTFRMWRFDYWAWLWSPIYRIKGFVWRKLHGYK